LVKPLIPELIGRGLMVCLGVYFWLYVLRPELPIVRGLGWSWWYGVRHGDPMLRVWYGVFGTIFIAAAVLV
jgi:hypothetical protein